MAEETRTRGLGRGLAALISDVGEESTGIDRARDQQGRRAAVDELFPSARNPRRRFAEEDLADLAASVRERGVVQPILVRRVPPHGYEIIAGERRWRAAQRAGVHDVPILVLDVGEREALEIAIVENVQRADLNALEEAAGYERLMTEFRYRQEDLARIIGKSRSHIANTMRLLKLSEPVKTSVREGALSAGHARALLTAEDPDALAATVIRRGLSVRDTEALAREAGKSARPAGTEAAPETKSADARALERSLGEATGLKVSLRERGAGGELRIGYGSLEQLDEIVRRLRG